ncbi:hypothetical protein [Allohahella marinimesophila]|uniref:Uncharacterized protein n=1 Tax=Allohahella marinimesophila TaxID=1054972 RepID=A0ABP7Q0T2_9GAMM
MTYPHSSAQLMRWRSSYLRPLVFLLFAWLLQGCDQPPQYSLLPADATFFAELADEEAVLLVPDVFSRILSSESLRSDRIHPNAEGYRELAEGIEEVLKESGLL